ncbi:circadian clock protein PASD1-like [Diceros bicornis minor]|uniref:circadian clock protein PASD1-like n=1 Tax=Diceros bicornis minor TaxID=77932 RepID=UPI0026ECD386|nr:circadian clock protein PASD1-like [Diceros bicornis minor]
MEEDDREKEQRDAPNTSENKEKDRVKTLFAGLRTLLQTHGYPVKGDRSKTAQSTTAVSQEEGKDNPETSTEESNWIPSFHTYENFNHMTLQSLDGFMIILSTDGVIIFVDENISSLLGYLPDEIMGKTLLRLLPDQEKNEVCGKIVLEFPLLYSVGKRIDFCCHLRRGNVQHGSSPTYEYAKFILSVKDISNEPLVLFGSSFFPSHSYAESSAMDLPLKDRFCLVGTVCILRTQILRELCTAKEAGEDIPPIEDSDEEHLSVDHRSARGQRESSRRDSLRDEPAAAASDVSVKQYRPQESVPVIQIESDTSLDSHVSSLETMPESPATSSLQSFEFDHEVEDVDEVGEVEQVDQMDEMEELEQVDEVEQIEQVERVEQEAQVEQVDQETVSSSSVAAGISDQPLQPPSSIASYINRRELELMKKFKEQLEEKTQMLQADIRRLQNALEMMREQLQTMQDSKFQMQPNTSLHIESPQSPSSEPVPKKQCTEQMKRSLPDLKEAKQFCGSYSSHSFKFSEECGEPYNASTQQHLQEQEQHLRQQLQQMQEQQMQQQMQEEQLQEQPPQHNVIVENQTLQIGLPNQTGLSVPLYDDPVTFMQTQPVVPVQLGAEQQPSAYYQDENLGGPKDESHSFLPEDQQGSSMNLLPMAHSPSSEIASICFAQCLIGSDPNLASLETPQEYIHLWQQPPDPQHHLYLPENILSSSEQAALQDQAAWPQQAPVPEAGARGPPGPEAFQAPAEYPPGKIGYFVPAEQSDLEQKQQQQYFQTKP